MNKYVFGTERAPTNQIFTEAELKNMPWLWFNEDTTPEEITSSGYVLLPELLTQAAEGEVLVADKVQGGSWTLSYVHLTNWTNTVRSKELAFLARTHRDALLKKSDWTQLSDVPTTISAPWAVYRQSLRDLPNQGGFPANIIWPIAPAN